MTTTKPKARRATTKVPAVIVPASRITKTELIFNLLRRPEGATLVELVEATGWLAHTARAALTGLRKKGHDLQKTKRDETTCYRVAAA
jgi:hypothetical protein